MIHRPFLVSTVFVLVLSFVATPVTFLWASDERADRPGGDASARTRPGRDGDADGD